MECLLQQQTRMLRMSKQQVSAQMRVQMHMSSLTAPEKGKWERQISAQVCEAPTVVIVEATV